MSQDDEKDLEEALLWDVMTGDNLTGLVNDEQEDGVEYDSSGDEEEEIDNSFI